MSAVERRECAKCKKTEFINRSIGESSAIKFCSKCQTVSYCSRECQLKDWHNHKNNCVDVIYSQMMKEFIKWCDNSNTFRDKIRKCAHTGYEKKGRGVVNITLTLNEMKNIFSKPNSLISNNEDRPFNFLYTSNKDAQKDRSEEIHMINTYDHETSFVFSVYLIINPITKYILIHTSIYSSIYQNEDILFILGKHLSKEENCERLIRSIKFSLTSNGFEEIPEDINTKLDRFLDFGEKISFDIICPNGTKVEFNLDMSIIDNLYNLL